MQKLVLPRRIAVLQPALWITLFTLSVLSLSSCSSQPAENPDPEWTKESTRLVDNGYIVYVGSAEDMKPEKAMLRAEGQALEDLANECSLVPKGTRIEDRYSKKPKYATTAFVKIAVEFELCEDAKKANDPDSMRRIAATSFMEQLKRYQDLEETGEMTSPGETASTEPPTQWPEAPVQSAGVSNQTQFFALRQTIFYQKEVVVLSPPQYYAPNSPETAQLNTSLQHNTQQLNAVVASNPELPKSPQTWSRLPQRPVLAKPESLHAPHRGAGARGHELRPPANPRREQARRPQPQQQKRGRGRGRRGRGEEDNRERQ